ncbi:MAG: hypothetical protein KGS72_05245 [Cyanobacteria bacterium REEB67]|nr:hypothetical protein [Cyanobacteria bacterium REEB67]
MAARNNVNLSAGPFARTRHQPLIVAAFAACLLAQGCGSSSKPEGTTPYLGEDPGMTKANPHDPLIDGAFPALRQDTFYTTYIEEGAKKTTLNDRFVANGKGFVAYCSEPGFDNGYYLYNFYGHTSYFVLIKDRTYKTVLASPADDLIVAYQHVHRPELTKKIGEDKVTNLKNRVIDGTECQGISYSFQGAKHEDWLDAKSGRIVEQTIEKGDRKIKRYLKRFNNDCDTMLLRLPQGFTPEK